MVLSENFDGVTAPALPAGWVASNAAGAAPLWVTSTTTPDTAPNDAFIDDPPVVTDKLLDTPSIAITSAAAQVSFRNFYNLESTFDGGVLEVSINGGAFTDITNATVGGSFVTGGYNATISTSFMSPIAGRMAWSGNAGGYINSVANLGANVNGQTIKLRFRMASDNSVSATGWRVDTVRVVDGACPSASPTASASGTPSATPSCPPVITQSSTQTITTGNSVSCNNGVGHTDNSYWRAFNMATFTGGAQYCINSVSFGVDSANQTQPVTVRLYTTVNFPSGFPGSLTQIGSATLNVGSAQNGTVVTTPLIATVPAGTSQLVMELFTPDGRTAGNLFFVGANAAGQAGPSYISAADCGIATPTDLASIGFPNMQIVFNVNGTCGTCVTPTPGNTPPPTATATSTASATPTATVAPSASPTGTPCGGIIFNENFDGVTAPVLPPGWVATNPDPGDGTMWVTSTSTPDTAPNDIFIPDQDGISDKVVVTPSITIPSASAVLSFRNNFNTEFSGFIFWDGGVLEVSSPNINGGAFTDITDPAVGGSFVSGGYTGEIDGTAGNPLAGRMAFSGNSGGYINTVVNLGPNVNGQTIKLRFRMGTDSAVAAPGWRVDTLRVVDGACPSSTPTATATGTPAATPTPTTSPTTTPCANYVVTNSSASIVPGTTDIGNHTDDGATLVALPFPVTLYGNTYNSAEAGSNGYLSFSAFVNNFYTGCLPNAGFSYTIFPFETDQNTVPAGRGIFTLTTGSTPFRTFYIEWRNCLYATATTCLANSNNNYEIVFQEGVSGFSIVYGTFDSANSTVGAIGVQDGAGFFTQLQCNLGRPTSSQQTYSIVGCPTPTPTPTPSGTLTPTPTPTVTPTPTPATPTPPPTVCDLTEGFDLITTLVPSGWVMQNNSQPGPGTTGWFQGNPTAFPAQSGAPNSYIAANFNNGTGTSTLSNWLLTPPVNLQNGAQLSFWTRTLTNVSFPDRLQVRMSTNGTSQNVGATATSVGDFTTLLLDINPTYTLTGYPNVWTNFVVTISGLGGPVKGRLAFRYFVENGGPSGANSDYIGIDTVQYACNGGFRLRRRQRRQRLRLRQHQRRQGHQHRHRHREGHQHNRQRHQRNRQRHQRNRQRHQRNRRLHQHNRRLHQHQPRSRQRRLRQRPQPQRLRRRRPPQRRHLRRHLPLPQLRLLRQPRPRQPRLRRQRPLRLPLLQQRQRLLLQLLRRRPRLRQPLRRQPRLLQLLLPRLPLQLYLR